MVEQSSPAGLSERLRAALAEVGRYEGRNRLYWWRRASMAKLEALGFVESYRPPSMAHGNGKTLPYRITPAGRAALEPRDGR